jgi:hypothetical protein
MTIGDVEDFIAYGLVALFALAGLVNATGNSMVRAVYRHWHYPRQFHRAVGALELVTALFLAVPQLRIWGVILGSAIAFFSVVALLNHRHYALSVPGMLLLVSLVPTALAHG